MGYLRVIDDRGPTRSCDCDRDEALECRLNGVERLVLDCNLSGSGDAGKAFFQSIAEGIVDRPRQQLRESMAARAFCEPMALATVLEVASVHR